MDTSVSESGTVMAIRWLSGSSTWVSLLGHQTLAPEPLARGRHPVIAQAVGAPDQAAVPRRMLGDAGVAVVVDAEGALFSRGLRGDQVDEEGVAVAAILEPAPRLHEAVDLERPLQVDLDHAVAREDPVGDAVDAPDGAVGGVDPDRQVVVADVPPGSLRRDRPAQGVRVGRLLRRVLGQDTRNGAEQDRGEPEGRAH